MYLYRDVSYLPDPVHELQQSLNLYTYHQMCRTSNAECLHMNSAVKSWTG